MALMEIRLNPTRRELRQFGFICLAAFALLGAWIAWRGSAFGIAMGSSAMTVATVFWIIGALAGLASAAYPPANRPLYTVLIVVTYPIGLVVSFVLMLFVFYVVFTPVGLFFRLIGRDPLHLRFEPEAKTYWVPHQPPASADRYYKQY